LASAWLFNFNVLDCLSHFVLLGLEVICQHEHGAVEEAGENTNGGQKADKGWHGRFPARLPAWLPFFAAIVKDAVKA
jgi:hypothetical protein